MEAKVLKAYAICRSKHQIFMAPRVVYTWGTKNLVPTRNPSIPKIKALNHSGAEKHKGRGLILDLVSYSHNHIGGILDILAVYYRI